MTKIVSLSQLFAIRHTLHPAKTIVLATGVFDVLHTEHKKFLQAAKKAGDVLLVGLEADYRIGQLKGNSRPVNQLSTRLKNIASFDIADYAFSLENTMSSQENREKFIRTLRPQTLAVSANTPFLSKKRQLMAKFGGQVKIVLPHNPLISTTKILST